MHEQTTNAEYGSTTAQRPLAVVAAAFDSQLKWAAGISGELLSRGFDVDVLAPSDKYALSGRQVAETGFDDVEPVSWDALVDRVAKADVVICALAGPRVMELTRDLDALGATPVVVAGWVGIIIENHTAGYLSRVGADIVAVNAQHDLDHFRFAAMRLGIPDDNLLLSGLPFLSTAPRTQPTGPIRTVLFADQPTVPTKPEDRLYLYRRLVDYAIEHPDRHVILKPRHKPGEDTFHRMHHHPEELLAGDELPKNFDILYDPISDLVDDVDLLLTISSTACLEALDAGCRVALVADLGVHEHLGNQVFLGSGLLRTFDEIAEDQIGEPSPDFVASYFGGREDSPARTIADRVEKLLASGERPSILVRDSAYFRASARADADRATVSHVPAGRWAARKRRLGPARGTAVHLGLELSPPVVTRTFRAVRGRVLR